MFFKRFNNYCEDVNCDMSWEAIIKALDNNYALIKEINKERLEKNEPLGYIINFPVGDGKAYYQAVEFKGNKARVEICNVGEGYTELVLGNGKWIDKQMVVGQFKLAKLGIM